MEKKFELFRNAYIKVDVIKNIEFTYEHSEVAKYEKMSSKEYHEMGLDRLLNDIPYVISREYELCFHDCEGNLINRIKINKSFDIYETGTARCEIKVDNEKVIKVDVSEISSNCGIRYVFGSDLHEIEKNKELAYMYAAPFASEMLNHFIQRQRDNEDFNPYKYLFQYYYFFKSAYDDYCERFFNNVSLNMKAVSEISDDFKQFKPISNDGDYSQGPIQNNENNLSDIFSDDSFQENLNKMLR